MDFKVKIKQPQELANVYDSKLFKYVVCRFRDCNDCEFIDDQCSKYPCVWLEPFNRVCCNSDSEHCADFISDMNICKNCRLNKENL